jgi:acyl carrier protein
MTDRHLDRPHPAAITRDDLRRWLVNQVSKITFTSPGQIDSSLSIYDLGVDSISAITLTADLEQFLGRPLPPTLLVECDNLEGVIDALLLVEAASISGRPLPDAQLR